jgi:acetyl esterase/lipase
MLDVQRAVRTVRSRAKELGIDPAKVGIMGFSAGGHLASTAITHFDSGRSDAEDPVERESSRPDAAILCYPVISMKPEVTHMGSRSNLLGAAPSAELETLMSNELQVTPQTPPAFLFHTTDDAVVKVENALLFYGALVKNRVPCEMHIYEKGRHGVGLAWDDPILSSWPARAADWLRRKGFTR